MKGMQYTVLDDSTTTPVANFTKTDIEGCNGVYINLMDAVLDPCAPDVPTAMPAPPTAATTTGDTTSSAGLLRAGAATLAALCLAALFSH